MPLIHNGLLNWLVLLQKAEVLTLILSDVLDHSIELAGSLRIKRIQQPVGWHNDPRHQFLAELPLVVCLIPARRHKM
jgi:hypothetical protein